jgi:hypothetical protein
MARAVKLQPPVNPVELDSPAQLITTGADVLPDELALDRLLTELESSETTAKVSIWHANRQDARGVKQKDEFLCTLSPADFAQYGLEGIQADYGPGDYRVRIFDDGGQMLHNRIHSVGPLSPKRKREIESEQRAQAPAAPIVGDSGLSQLASAMQAGFHQLAQLLAGQQNNRRQMLEELTLYKQLFAPSGTVSAPASDPLQTFLSAANFIKDLGVGKTAETNTLDIFMKLAEEFGPAIADIAKAQISQRSGAALIPNTPERALTIAPPVSDLHTQPPEQTMDALARAVKPFLPMFVAQAAAGNDPYKYADMILDHVPVEVVSAFCARADWLEYLAAMEPGVSNHAQWFNTLRANLQEIILTESQEESTQTGSDEISSGE